MATINEISEISKFVASIESVRVGLLSCSLFYYKPNPFLFKVDDLNPIVSATIAEKPNTVSPELLSKVWNINVSISTKALDQNTQLNCQGSNNDLYIHFSNYQQDYKVLQN